MVVPHGSDPSRTFDVTERGLRRGALAAIGGGTVFLLAVGLLVRAAAAHPSVALVPSLAASDVAGLRDTIAMIAKRDSQIRLLAGLPQADTVHAGRPGRRTDMDIDGLISQANTLSASFAEVSTTLERSSERMASTPSIMPTAGWLSSEFSKARFHPILHVERPHEGIDLAAPYGAPVVAPAAGTVTRIARETGYGLVLEIDHGNGITTKYAHLSSVAVHVGQHVTRADPIAAVGNSGLATGPHLHYEIHVNGRAVDPLTFVLPGAIPD
jgi:murein DD-endopeptidase MepM/ murein hydrolase activator NlpD